MKGLTRLTRSMRCAATPIALLAIITAVAIVSVMLLSFATHAVSIHDGESVQTVYTMSSNPEDILNASGVQLSDADSFVHSGIGSANGEIKLVRAFPVSIDANGNTYYIETTGGTVRDILAHAGVTVDSDDEINVSLDAAVTADMTIAVTSVDFSTEIKEVSIPYGTKVVYSNTLPKGQTTVTKGKEGVKLVTYTYKHSNGKLVDSSVTEEVISVNPVDEIKTVGTKVEASKNDSKPASGTYSTCGKKYVSALKPDSDFAVDANGIPTNYKKKISGIASAYSGGGITSTGKGVRTGYVAVDPKEIPYGTKMYIRCKDGSYIYGYAVAQDTGGFTKTTDRVVDLYFNTKSECIRFGLRNVDIYLL